MEAALEELEKDETPLGFLAVGVLRGILFGLKRGAITGYVKKTAFLRIGSLTTNKRRTASTSSKNKDVRHYLTNMAKNTLLGMTVFGTYEFVAFNERFVSLSRDSPSYDTKSITSIPIAESIYAITAGSTPVVLHGVAGLLSGVAQSMVTLAWDFLFRHRPHWNAIQKQTIHHSIGYASLFGTYEAVRRLLEFGFYDVLSKQEARILNFIRLHPDKINWMRGEDGDFDITPVRSTFSFLAGGVAGQVYHVVSHALANPKSIHSLKGLLWRPKTISSFWITGLCFVAFEYGGQLTERMVHV